MIISLYLLYCALRGDIDAIIFCTVSYAYLRLFTRKSEGFIKYITSLEAWKYFKKFEVISEDEVERSGCLLPMHPHSLFCYGF